MSFDPQVRRHAIDTHAFDGILWNACPWQDEFYEGLLNQIEDCLKKVLKYFSVNYDELQSVIVEIEAFQNSRQLCYVGDETESVLTLAHFLILKRLTSSSEEEYLASQTNLVQCYRGSRCQVERFWRMWSDHNLTSLREKGWNKQGKQQQR